MLRVVAAHGPRGVAREPPEARILHKHMYEPVPSLAACMSGWCPPQREAVIAACLAKDVAVRPRDARAIAAMLGAIEIPAMLQ